MGYLLLSGHQLNLSGTEINSSNLQLVAPMKSNLISFKFFSFSSWLFSGLLLLGLFFNNLADQSKTNLNLTKQSNPTHQVKTAAIGPKKNTKKLPKKNLKTKKVTKSSIAPKIPDITPKNSYTATSNANLEIAELEEFILDDITGLKINGTGLTVPQHLLSNSDDLTPTELTEITSADLKSGDMVDTTNQASNVITAVAPDSAEPEKLAVTMAKPTVKYHGRYKPRQSNLKKILFLTKDFKDLNSEEVSERTKEHLANQDYRSAATCVEREMALCKNHNQICKLRLARADIWLAAGDVEKAAAGYREFIAQYPSHPQTEYAKYQLIKILFDAMPTCDRDQSGTSEALQTAREFLANMTYTKYRTEVEKISQRCYCQLFDSEVKKFEFYVNHRHFLAANKRFKYIEKTYPEFTAEIAELQKWLTAMETGQSYILPENMRSKRTKKHYYGAKKRNYGAMF